MRIICHRGNLDGPKPKWENHPLYLTEAMDAGFCVEIDLWAKPDENGESKLWFGHDKPQFQVESTFFKPNGGYDPFDRIYFHCKNLQALLFCNLINWSDSFGPGCKYFSHNQDPYTLVSDGSIWTYPDSKNELSILSIPVVFGRNDMKWTFDQLKPCEGICTDDALYFDALFNASAI
jgi:hypothetical protein